MNWTGIFCAYTIDWKLRGDLNKTTLSYISIQIWLRTRNNLTILTIDVDEA